MNFLQYKYFEPQVLSDYVRERYRDLIYDPERIGERILPSRNVDDYEVDFGKVKLGRPPAAPIVAPGATFPEFSFQAEFDEKKFRGMKMGLRSSFREDQLERMRRIIQGTTTGPITFSTIMNSEPYAVADKLLTAILDMLEAIRWQLLANDSFIVSNNLAISWDVPALNKTTLTGTSVWSDLANADGIQDLIDMNTDAVDRYGASIREVYLSHQALQNLLAQESTKTRLAGMGMLGLGPEISPAAAQYRIISPMMVEQYISNTRSNNNRNTSNGLRFITYDRMYGKYDFEGNTPEVQTRFLPANKLVAIMDDPITRNEPVLLDAAPNGFGYTANMPVAEDGFTTGPFLWMSQEMHPLRVSQYITAWGVPIADGERIFQMQIDA